MAPRADAFDLGGLRLSAGEARRLELGVACGPFKLAGQRYTVEPAQVVSRLDVCRTTGKGYALRLRLQARLVGPCMRCLGPADPVLEVDGREVWQPGEGDELASPYVEREVLDLRGWAHDALALAIPTQLRCGPECAGLCTVCGADLNHVGPEHRHEPQPDPRWAKLSELKLDR